MNLLSVGCQVTLDESHSPHCSNKVIHKAVALLSHEPVFPEGLLARHCQEVQHHVSN